MKSKMLFVIMGLVALSFLLQSCSTFNQATRDERPLWKKPADILKTDSVPSGNKDAVFTIEEAGSTLMTALTYQQIIDEYNSGVSENTSQNTSEEKLINGKGLLGMVENPHQSLRLTVKIIRPVDGFEDNFDLEPKGSIKHRLFPGQYRIIYSQAGKNTWEDSKLYEVSAKKHTTVQIGGKSIKLHFKFMGWSGM